MRNLLDEDDWRNFTWPKKWLTVAILVAMFFWSTVAWIIVEFYGR